MSEDFASFFQRISGDAKKPDLPAIAAPSATGSKGLVIRTDAAGALVSALTADGLDVTPIAKASMETVVSKSFIQNLSNEIGTPKETESEDDFVARAKAAARKLLLKSFEKK